VVSQGGGLKDDSGTSEMEGKTHLEAMMNADGYRSGLPPLH
jgi:hypothetical protein